MSFLRFIFLRADFVFSRRGLRHAIGVTRAVLRTPTIIGPHRQRAVRGQAK
jgi:hypothetical protein